MASTVEVRLELGHKAKVRDVPSPEGHTHDWEVFVKGTDGIRLEHFVEKVVFWLHESYEPPGRVIKHPPYKVKESGFAGFNMLIDVHFRNKEEPKTVRFQYDLFLHTESMPPVNHTRLEKLTFTNPTEDFRKKLLSAGAVLVNASSGSRHSSKDRSSRTVSPSSKKESSKSRDGSKHRESGSSSNKLHGDRKRSSSHSKKDGRIPTKDMKKHDENFKLPKNPNSSEKKSKEEVGERSETNYHERGRPEKRRSAAGDEDGNKKKKKKHSDEPPQRPKSLNVSSGSTSSNTQKKDKEKVRRIKEKPDLMAGLFAPENSINMTQIKQSKEKAKQEDLKIKKEKSSMSTPSRNSPHPSQEETSVVHSAKISPAGNLTLKIKREKIPSTEKEKKVKESSANQISNSKRGESVDKEKKRSKESSSKTRIPERKPEPKRTPVVSSDSSLSGSDMDISDLESSADENLTEKIKVHVPKVEEKVKSKSKPDNSVNRDSPKRKLEKKNSTPVMVKQESKVKSENRSFKESPSQSKPAIKKEKSRRDSVTTKEKSEKVSTKHKKSGKDKDKDHSERESTPSSKPKKHKRSSKEKVLAKQPSKDVQRSSPPEKEKALSSTPNTERIAPKKKSTDYPSPSLKSHEASSPATVSKPKKASVSPKPTSRPNKSPKPANVPPIKKEKDINIRKEIHKKPPSVPSKKTSSKNSSKHEEKSKPVFKSRSFVETSSDDSEESDDEIPPPLAHKVIPKKISPIRKDSISSQSSAVSDNHSMTSDDEKHHVPHQHPQALPHSSSSSDSSDGELNMSGLPLENTANLSVISPIRESNSHIENTIDATTAYQDMEMSDSSDDSPFHEPNIEEEKHPTQGNELENLVPTEDNNHENREKGFRDLGLSNDFDTSSDEESDAPVEKPFQNQEEYAGSPGETENLHQDEQGPSTDLPDVITKVGSVGNYPEMNDTLYQELQELQKKISYITDVERLRKIATIVAKSQKLVKNDEYFDFDLCSLDHRTINKIQKQLKAI